MGQTAAERDARMGPEMGQGHNRIQERVYNGPRRFNEQVNLHGHSGWPDLQVNKFQQSFPDQKNP